jgi:hypothetical protein
MSSSEIGCTEFATVLVKAHSESLAAIHGPEDQEKRQLREFCDLFGHIAGLMRSCDDAEPNPDLRGQVGIVLPFDLLVELIRTASLLWQSVQSVIEASRTAGVVDADGWLTEPLSKKEIAMWFGCGRNGAKDVLSELWNRPIGGKHQMRVRDMPVAYRKKWATAISKIEKSKGES